MNKYTKGLIAVIIVNLLIGAYLLFVSLIMAISQTLPQIYIFFFSIFSIIYLIIGVGLIKLRNWARISAIVFFSIAIIETLFFQFYLKKFTSLDIVSSLFKVIISAWMIIYLLKGSIRLIFCQKKYMHTVS